MVDLLQLRYFQAVAHHQHVSRAAAELHVAQPALSRSIARLETELGVPLFDRHGRRVRLNRFGTLFLARVARAIGELDQGQHELHDAAGLTQGVVAIAAETLRTVTDLTARFLTGHPGVSLQLYQSPAPVMSAQLQAGEVNLCVASQRLDGARAALGGAPQRGSPPRRPPVAPPGPAEPAVRGRPARWRALRHHPPRLLAAKPHRPALRGRGRRPTIACEGDEPYAIRGLISAGAGIGLMPAVARRRLAADPPVAWLHLEAPAPRRTLSLVWRTDAYLSAAARALISFAISHFDTWRGDA